MKEWLMRRPTEFRSRTERQILAWLRQNTWGLSSSRALVNAEYQLRQGGRAAAGFLSDLAVAAAPLRARIDADTVARGLNEQTMSDDLDERLREAFRLLRSGGEVLFSDAPGYAALDKAAVRWADFLGAHGGEPF